MTTAPTTTRKRGPGRPRNQDYDGVILDATMAILAEDGYQGLTIDGVAARAKVGRPTIYRRWPSKPALVVAALARSTGLAPAPDTGSLRDDLLAVQRHQVRLMNSDGFRRITPGLVADLVADPDLARTYLDEYIAPRRRSVWDALDRGVARGELPPGIDHAFISDLLTGPLFYRALVRGEHLEPEAAERTVDVVLAAHPTATQARPADSEDHKCDGQRTTRGNRPLPLITRRPLPAGMAVTWASRGTGVPRRDLTPAHYL